MTENQSITLNRLVQSKANVRQTGQTSGIEALMASIAAHGLRQNLNVRPTTGGRFEVIAGGRRLIALKKLARAGTVPADMPVPCLVLADNDNPTEISLAENQLREAMHPDDQCAAFQTLIGDGMPVEDIAARFGVTPAVVRQRLRLAAVSPKLRALYRKGETTLAQMMALTLTDDHAAQETALAEGGSPHGIRAVLTQDTVRMNARLVTFVGLDAYRAAGGGVIDDLFNPEDGFLTDAALLDRLATAKLAGIAATVQAEGWAWVKVELTRDYATDYRRIHGEPQDGGGIAYGPEQLAQAGARVTIGHAGQVDVDRGLVRPEDARRQAGGGADEAAPARADYPASLVTELTGHRTAALRLALAQRPDVALMVMVHAMVLAHQRQSGLGTCLSVAVRHRDLSRVVADLGECSAHAGMDAALERWHHRLPGKPADLWAWCRQQDQATLLDVLATFAALALDDVSDRDGSTPGCQLAAALDLDMAAHWQPTAAFMSRLRKPVIAAALTEAGQDAAAADVVMMKKPAAAAKAAQALAGTGWLPLVLRCQDAAAVNDTVPVALWEGDDVEMDEEAA